MNAPSPEQIAEWRKEFELPLSLMPDYLKRLPQKPEEYKHNEAESEWQGYLRARAEQATEIAALKALAETLKNEAQIHAMEARGTNATINEINKFISGATGEPANWHGAQPVKEYVNGLKAQIAELMPLAKFGALIATNGTLNLSDDAYKSGVFKDPNFLCKHDNIEATITKLLKG
jgi:hypothetical protein